MEAFNHGAFRSMDFCRYRAHRAFSYRLLFAQVGPHFRSYIRRCDRAAVTRPIFCRDLLFTGVDEVCRVLTELDGGSVVVEYGLAVVRKGFPLLPFFTPPTCRYARRVNVDEDPIVIVFPLVPSGSARNWSSRQVGRAIVRCDQDAIL